MKVRRDGIEGALRGAGRSALPAALKPRVMDAVELPAGGVTWRDRLWFSRGWRVAAAAICLAVVAGESLMTQRPPAEAATASPRVEREAAVQSGAEIGVPETEVERLAARVEFGPPGAQEMRPAALPAGLGPEQPF